MKVFGKGIFYNLFKRRINGIIEVNKMNQIEYEETKRFKFLKDLRIDALIDIGANEGQFSARVRRVNSETKIFAFEPIHSAFTVLASYFENDLNFKSYNYALGDKNEEVDILLSEYTPSSSILAMNDSHNNLFEIQQSGLREKVTIKKLNDFEQDFLNYDSLCLKIDVQGFEDKVILGGDRILEKTKVILIETSFIELYENQILFIDIFNKLQNLGFSFHGTFDQLYSSKYPFPVQADSIFIKRI